MHKPVLSALVAAFLSASCGLKQEVKEDYPVRDFADGPLAGLAGGKEWVMKSGHVKRSGLGGSQIAFAFKSDDNDKGCDGVMRGLDGVTVGITVEEALGEQELKGTTVPATIAVGEDVYTTTGNKIDIAAITETAVTGRLSMYTSDEIYVNGSFSALRCF